METAAVGRLGVFDGEPYVVPVNFVYREGKVWFHCACEGRKIQAILKDPRVCFEVDDFLGLKEGARPCSFGAYFRSVVAYGVARIIGEIPRKREAMKMLMAKYAGDKEWFFEDAELERVAVVEITVTTMTGKSRLP